MRTVTITCTECSILNALLEYIMMTAVLEYLNLFIQIRVAEKWSNQCQTLSRWAPALLSTTAIDSIKCGTVMLFCNV